MPLFNTGTQLKKIFIFLFYSLSSTLLFSQTNNVQNITPDSLLKLFKLGGIFMYPLLAFSITSVGIILERTITFIFSRTDVSKFMNSIIALVKDKKISEALDLCQGEKNYHLLPIVKSGLDVLNEGLDRVEKAMESQSIVEINHLERGLDLLSAIGSLAPITGFLGTVSGMISAFYSIAIAENVNAQLVASGIYEALITTAFGLIIAIFTIAAHNVFKHLIERFAVNVEKNGNDLINTLIKYQVVAK